MILNKKIKFIISEVLVCSLVGTSIVCYAKSNESTTAQNNIEVSEVKESTSTPEVKNESTITLKDNETKVEGSGVSIEGNIITINAAGTYTVSGELSDGQIIVDAGKEDEVEIVLDGVNITCSNGSAIYVKCADETILNLKKGTENNIEDGSVYSDKNVEDGVNGAIFSKDDLKIKGSGTLNVTGNYNNGIVSKDDLKIKNGIINVTALNNGLKGKDSIQYEDATLTVNAQGDAIKSDNDEDEDKGYIEITSGTLNITSGEDALQAENYVNISGGTFNILSGGGSSNAVQKGNNDFPKGSFSGFEDKTTEENLEDTSMKGIKGNKSIIISNGTFNIDSADDALHSNGSINISGGTFEILSGDDGIHADESLTIDNGNINIKKSYEGLESESITINDGDIKVVSSDDGINASEGSEATNETENKAGGFGQPISSGNAMLTINGGTLYVNAGGDGLDSNGSIVMTEGTAIIDGPTNNGNGALDYDKTFNISGGTLIATGSSGMAQSVSNSSTQNALKVTLNQYQVPGTIINIQDSEGNNIITYSPSKQYNSIVVSSPKIKTDEQYTINVGGKVSGEAINGLYEGGEYTGGTKFQSFKVSSILTNINSLGATEGTNNDGMMGGGGPHGGDGDFNKPEFGTNTPSGRPERPGHNSTNTPDGQFPEDGRFPGGGEFPGGGQFPGGGEFSGDGQFPGDDQLPNDGQISHKDQDEATTTPSDDSNSGNTSDSSRIMVLMFGAISALFIKFTKVRKGLKIRK